MPIIARVTSCLLSCPSNSNSLSLQLGSEKGPKLRIRVPKPGPRKLPSPMLPLLLLLPELILEQDISVTPALVDWATGSANPVLAHFAVVIERTGISPRSAAAKTATFTSAEGSSPSLEGYEVDASLVHPLHRCTETSPLKAACKTSAVCVTGSMCTRGDLWICAEVEFGAGGCLGACLIPALLSPRRLPPNEYSG